MKERYIYIRSLEDDSVVKTIKTTKTGGNLNKLLNGLDQRVDFNRFYIDSSEVEER